MTESNILALPAGVNDCEILIDGEVNGQPAILSTKESLGGACLDNR